MSRQFNPAITIYNRLAKDMENKPKQTVSKSRGLLGPREDKIKQNMSEDINEPITRVKQHMAAIQKYKADRNA